MYVYIYIYAYIYKQYRVRSSLAKAHAPRSRNPASLPCKLNSGHTFSLSQCPS